MRQKRSKKWISKGNMKARNQDRMKEKKDRIREKIGKKEKIEMISRDEVKEELGK
jgi:hypothetical protein